MPEQYLAKATDRYNVSTCEVIDATSDTPHGQSLVDEVADAVRHLCNVFGSRNGREIISVGIQTVDKTGKAYFTHIEILKTERFYADHRPSTAPTTPTSTSPEEPTTEEEQTSATS